MTFIKLPVAIGIILGLLSGCDFSSQENLIGPYRLTAIDGAENTMVCFSLPGDDCIGRIQGTVFSVGWNDRFIVAKQHPKNNKAVTNYFILDIPKDSMYADPRDSVIGPLSEQDFREQSRSLALPDFHKTNSRLQ